MSTYEEIMTLLIAANKQSATNVELVKAISLLAEMVFPGRAACPQCFGLELTCSCGTFGVNSYYCQKCSKRFKPDEAVRVR